MAKETISFEQVTLLETAELSDSAVRSFEGGSKPWATGEYAFLNQEHFTIESEFNGTKVPSNRVLAFKLGENDTVEYIRSWKTRMFNDFCYAIGVAKYRVEVEDRDGHVRIKRGQDVLTGKMIRATNSMVPVRVENKKLHIVTPFIAHVLPRVVGVSAIYEGNQKDGYDVVLNEDGTAKFQTVTITPFEVTDRVVTANIVDACKKALAKNSYLSKVELEY